MPGPEFVKSQVCIRYILATAIIILLSLIMVSYIYYLDFQSKLAILYAAAIMAETSPDMVKIKKDSDKKETFQFEYKPDPLKFTQELSEYDLANMLEEDSNLPGLQTGNYLPGSRMDFPTEPMDF